MSEYNITTKIKKPGKDKLLTPEQESEWIKCALDKDYWMTNYCYVETADGPQLFKPRKYQSRIIDIMTNNRFGIFLSGRQSGKTTTLGADILHDMLFETGTAVGITSYKLSNCKDFIDRIKFSYENLPDWMKPPVIEYNKFNIVFETKSRVMAQVTKENTFRGITLHRIVSDELAFVKEDIAEEFIGSILPSISAAGSNSKTRFQIISTANGTSGQFAQLWFGASSKQNGFAYTEVEYEEVPGRDAAFEKDMIGKIGLNKFLQEFKNAFISDKGTLVNSRVIEALKTIDPVEEIGDLMIYVDSFKDRKVGMACDVSEGIGQDYHAFQIFDLETMEQLAEYQNNQMSQSYYTKQIIRTIEFLFDRGASEVYYTVENNGIGAGVLRLLENSDNKSVQNAMLISDEGEDKSGIKTTGKNRSKSCAQLKDLIELGKMKINSEKLKVQLKFFVKKGGKFQAESGTHDDLVMACVIFCNMLEMLVNYEDSVYDTMMEIDDDIDDEEFGICF